MIKVLPNLRDGIQIVGFLKEIDEQKNGEEEADTDLHFHYIIYNANTNVVLGVTKNCFDLFGIPASLVYGNSNNTVEFTMDGIAPDLVRPENYDVLKSQGLSCFIDTTTIQ
jgi:hypothetical protein